MDSSIGSGGIGPARQTSIYLSARRGEKPTIPFSVEQLEQAAREVLSPEAYDYVAGGAGGEFTMRANRAAFDQWRILPRMLTDVSDRSLGITLFGRELPAPILLGPVGVQGIVHSEAETAVARAAASQSIPFVLSTVSSHSIESVAESAPEAPRWFQLYTPANRDLAASLVGRAERAGYEAIVVTLDTPILGWRERDLQRGYLPFLSGNGLANYFTDPVFRASLTSPPESDPITAVRAALGNFGDPSLTWNDLAFLREATNLPVLLKGIVHPDDADRALDAGVDGIIVSNHGGRQVDGAIGAFEALPSIVGKIDGRIPVLFDSGIRRGSDIVKALGMGAKAVLIGRPYMWALAVAAEQGVRELLQNLIADLDVTMTLSGMRTIKDIKPDCFVHCNNPV